MSDRETVPRGFESPYQSFLWKELSIIREFERQGEHYRALHYAVSLLKYLAPEVRRQLAEEGKRIIDTVNYAISRAKGPNHFTGWIVKNRMAERFGHTYLEEFITMLSDSLGERAYMEKRGRRVSHGRFEG